MNEKSILISINSVVTMCYHCNSVLLLADRMVAAENDVKTLKQEHAAKDAEISKLTNGLTIAFGEFFFVWSKNQIWIL